MSEAIRDVFGKTLVELGRENPNIVALDADLASSTRMTYFAEAFPERFFQMGIAEQNMIGVAVGMALMGKVPVVGSFAVFATRRVCDQVAIGVAHCRTNVKIVGAYAGIMSGNCGATHQAVEDIAIMRALPSIAVVEPADDVEMEQALRAVVAYDGPVYLRAARDAWPRVSPEGYGFALGKAVSVREGNDVTLVGCGVMISQCVEAAQALSKEGIEARVLNAATIKPIDIDAITLAAKETGAVVTAENHNIFGGLGSAVAEVLGEHAPVPMERIGIRDCYGECGTNAELLAKYGMSPEHIAEAARAAIRRKSS